MITFDKIILVFVDDKHVGTINKVKGGWAYFSQVTKKPGPTFKRLTACQKSLCFPDPIKHLTKE